MCVCWPRFCVAAHVICSVIYICAGAVQLIAGIFFLISLPVFKVGSNLWTGGWNVLVGVAGAVFTCVGDLTPSKHQTLLYLTISVIAVNVVNLVILEVGEWRILMPDAIKKVIQQKNLKTLVFYARTTTSISTVVTVITSFIDAQLMFCWLERNLRPRTPIHHNETVSDIEYIIPRAKSGSMGKNNSHNVFNQYAQSWVFDTDTVGSSQSDSPYSKMPPQFSGSKTVVLKRKQRQEQCNNATPETPAQPVVLVEDVSNSDRQLQFMTSFSRTPSPVGMSDSSSLSSNAPHIYECLERLTEPSVYRSRLNNAINANIERNSPSISPRPHSAVISDQVQYASLMMELEKTIVNKFPPVKSPNVISESTSRHGSRRASSRDESLQKSLASDTEFSKELEAALQLIQDLESPNTVDTPSEGPQQMLAEDSDSGASSKTLSETVNMPGKDCVILQTGSTTVITLSPIKKYTSIVNIVPSDDSFEYENSTEQVGTLSLNAKDLSSISSDNADDNNSNILYTNGKINNKHEYPLSGSNTFSCNRKLSFKDSSFNSDSECNNNVLSYVNRKCTNPKLKSSSLRQPRWSIKNILKRKPSQLKLCPELENTLLKSESLVHLTENELIARYNRDKMMHRQIEERAWQQITGTSVTDSTC